MSQSGGWGLSPSERKELATEGGFLRRDLFSEGEVEELRAAVSRVAQRISGDLPSAAHYDIDGKRFADTGRATVQFEPADPAAFRVVEPCSIYDPRLAELLADPRLLQPMTEILGCPRVDVFTDKLNFKAPRVGSGFPWHQDAPYWAHACDHLDRLCNVMVSLDDADLENGCFRIQRGSHRTGILPGREGEGRLGPLFTAPEWIRSECEQALPMRAGSVFFFDAHLIHGSGPNPSPDPRRALVLTYQPGGHPRFDSGSGGEKKRPPRGAGTGA